MALSREVREYAGLRGSARAAMDRLDDVELKTHAERLRLQAQEAALYRAVFEALEEGISANLVGLRLGVSRSRVYQMRDRVRAEIGSPGG